MWLGIPKKKKGHRKSQSYSPAPQGVQVLEESSLARLSTRAPLPGIQRRVACSDRRHTTVPGLVRGRDEGRAEALVRCVTDRSMVAEGRETKTGRVSCARRANEGIGDHRGCAERAETGGAVVLVHWRAAEW
jgi:hypothetical protein